jgi:chemotaxis protein MotB
LNRKTTPASRKKDEDDDGFMVSFAALMILLLTFMILLVTLASFREPKFRRAIGSVRGALSFLPHAVGKGPQQAGGAGVLPEEILAEAVYVETEHERAYRVAIQKLRRRSGMPELAGLEIDEKETGLAIRVADALIFDRGRAELKYDILPVLDLIAEAVRAKPGRISIVGNTCDLPISTHEFPSNWELSVVRAVNVLHYFESRSVPPESLFAYGLADQCPIVPNDSEANRCRNRRVEILVSHTVTDARFHDAY